MPIDDLFYIATNPTVNEPAIVIGVQKRKYERLILAAEYSRFILADIVIALNQKKLRYKEDGENIALRIVAALNYCDGIPTVKLLERKAQHVAVQ